MMVCNKQSRGPTTAITHKKVIVERVQLLKLVFVRGHCNAVQLSKCIKTWDTPLS